MCLATVAILSRSLSPSDSGLGDPVSFGQFGAMLFCLVAQTRFLPRELHVLERLFVPYFSRMDTSGRSRQDLVLVSVGSFRRAR